MSHSGYGGKALISHCPPAGSRIREKIRDGGAAP
jgi:hypothetical protein